ncbi:MAG: GTP 3',8-cyclase MoaA [Desulfuromonadaceae bacterium]
MKYTDSLVDPYQRKINYMRLSLTDRCNLRCVYCMPAHGVKAMRHDDILSYEDMLFLAQTAIALGVEKIRLTGGEPLVRKGVTEFLQRLIAIPGLQHLSLTTNGLLLERYASSLKSAGVKWLNVSIDSLQPQRYAEITRGGDLATWWRGIEAAQKAGLHLKLNVVVIRGVNDAEIEDFAALAQHNPWSVRFIEYMPTAAGPGANLEGLASDELLQRLQQKYVLTPVARRAQAGPAHEFDVVNGSGHIGVISAVSCPFCHNCNRIRVSASGKGRSCLFGFEEVDLKNAIKQRREDKLIAALYNLVEQKPQGHMIKGISQDNSPVPMSAIGG